jgi:hypothetical protein
MKRTLLIKTVILILLAASPIGAAQTAIAATTGPCSEGGAINDPIAFEILDHKGGVAIYSAKALLLVIEQKSISNMKIYLPDRMPQNYFLSEPEGQAGYNRTISDQIHLNFATNSNSQPLSSYNATLALYLLENAQQQIAITKPPILALPPRCYGFF